MVASVMAASFTADTAVRPLSDHTFSADITESWGVGRGANGGYQLAILLRALIHAERGPHVPLSLTAHFLRPARVGPAIVEISSERKGSSIHVWRASLIQYGVQAVVALASFTARFTELNFENMTAPRVSPPEQTAALARSSRQPSYLDNWELRPCLGALPFSSDNQAETGGWLRSVEAEALDSCTVAAMTDAWIPAAYVRHDRPVIIPTLDMTIHFRNLPPPQWDYCLVSFRSRYAHGGYVEEDGEIWSRSGVLLAQSRQLLFSMGDGNELRGSSTKDIPDQRHPAPQITPAPSP